MNGSSQQPALEKRQNLLRLHSFGNDRSDRFGRQPPTASRRTYWQAARLWIACPIALALAGNDRPPSDLLAKPASPFTLAAQKQAAASLPVDDGKDADFASRGFLATRDDPVIRSANGAMVWDLSAFDFMKGDAPASVNPGLWRQTSLLRRHGLFAVAPGIWQVRGFDVSNMTIVQGETGWILIDPLNTRETATAALALVNSRLGRRPVKAVIYSHSHSDHFGGVRGVVDEADVLAGKVSIYAPVGFMEESTSENLVAAPVTGRRGIYQFGIGLAPGPQGQMGSGLSTSVAAGEITLIAPTNLIARTGDKVVIDGVPVEFQIVSGSEAPAEVNLLFPAKGVFLSAEMSTCSLHNILTPRGAKVRDAKIWAGYLDEALRLYGDRTQTLISSHCWPRFGQDNVMTMLANQRDNYRFLHDQTVRLMNEGQTAGEIAEQLAQPPTLADHAYDRGYYGTYKHNAKAVYQFYLGWYDAVPANLDPWPPAERARRMVEALGGERRVLKLARQAMARGDYRWSSDLLNQLLFAGSRDPWTREALADSYEQQGYQAASGTWRNQFLSAARELRQGRARTTLKQNRDMTAAVPSRMLMDVVATRFDPQRFAGRPSSVNLVMPDRGETVGVELTENIMLARDGALSAATVTVTAPRDLIMAMAFKREPLPSLERAGLVISGHRHTLEAWLNAIVPPSGDFDIVMP
jgi:alkyl sulfatase BDS1-like metallo-beta-lactamase superfamily hydrolase